MTSLKEIQKQLPPSCQILAVSKLQSSEKIRALHQAGQIHFGENYVQEAKEKQQELRDLNLHWHLIGHLQKNKAKDILGAFDLIHSVDSLELAQTLNQRLLQQNKKQNVLLQINLAGELTKGGFSEKDLESQWAQLKTLVSLEIRGLMTMPPLNANPELSRPYFRRLREWRDQLAKQDPRVKELSMGTSGDFLVAAEEGATWVRLGTVLFGERLPR